MAQEKRPLQSRIDITRKLKVDSNYVPCPAEAGDEVYPNGVFRFNITKLLEYIQQNPEQIILENIPLENFSFFTSSTLNEDHLLLVDITWPIILAEIAPGRYNVIDGNHRLEKARRVGAKTIPAYRVHVHQHIRFLTEKSAYLAYVEYWNSKF